MPRDKDLKRVVRTRMQKTGESYTTARARILDKPAPGSATTAAPATPDFAALAGKRDALVLEKTGRTWEQWVHELDRRHAHELAHADLARLISAEYGVSMWWTQSVTVGYERIKGLRAVGQRRGGAFEASRSRTFPVAADALFELAANARRRAHWWAGVKVEARPDNRTPAIRARHVDGTTTVLYFTARTPAKTTLTAVGSGLPDRAAADAFKTTWGDRFDRLGALIR